MREVFWRNYGRLCGAMRSLPCVCCPVCCVCRNLRIRASPTPPPPLYTQCPRRSGAWVLVRPGVPSALILRLRQNGCLVPRRLVHKPPSTCSSRERQCVRSSPKGVVALRPGPITWGGGRDRSSGVAGLASVAVLTRIPDCVESPGREPVHLVRCRVLGASLSLRR